MSHPESPTDDDTPQLGNGFVQISYDLLFAILTELGGTKGACLAAVIRDQYGAKKLDSGTIPRADIAEALGVSRDAVRMAIQRLSQGGLLKPATGGHRLDKNYRKWTTEANANYARSQRHRHSHHSMPQDAHDVTLDRNDAVTERNEAVTERNEAVTPSRNDSVTGRNEAVRWRNEAVRGRNESVTPILYRDFKSLDTGVGFAGADARTHTHEGPKPAEATSPSRPTRQSETVAQSRPAPTPEPVTQSGPIRQPETVAFPKAPPPGVVRELIDWADRISGGSWGYSAAESARCGFPLDCLKAAMETALTAKNMNWRYVMGIARRFRDHGVPRTEPAWSGPARRKTIAEEQDELMAQIRENQRKRQERDQAMGTIA